MRNRRPITREAVTQRLAQLRDLLEDSKARVEPTEAIAALWQRYHAICVVDSAGVQRLPPERYDEAKAIFSQIRELLNAQRVQ